MINLFYASRNLCGNGISQKKASIKRRTIKLNSFRLSLKMSSDTKEKIGKTYQL